MNGSKFERLLNKLVEEIDQYYAQTDTIPYPFDYSLFSEREARQVQVFFDGIELKYGRPLGYPTSDGNIVDPEYLHMFDLAQDDFQALDYWKELETALREGDPAKVVRIRRRMNTSDEELLSLFQGLDLGLLTEGSRIVEGHIMFSLSSIEHRSLLMMAERRGIDAGIRADMWRWVDYFDALHDEL